jgi:hypothetical protein
MTILQRRKIGENKDHTEIQSMVYPSPIIPKFYGQLITDHSHGVAQNLVVV